jgi:hypothetical protein
MSSLLNSKVFATCYTCKEKVNIQNKKKRFALQEIDLNISPSLAKQQATLTF